MEIENVLGKNEKVTEKDLKKFLNSQGLSLNGIHFETNRNEVFPKHLNKAGIEEISLDKAAIYLKKYFENFKPELFSNVYLNAFFQNPTILRVKDNLQLDQPVFLKLPESGIENLIIIIGKSSRLDIIRLGEAKNFRMHNIKILLDEDSSLKYYGMHAGSNSIQMSSELFYLKNNSFLECNIASFSHFSAYHMVNVNNLGDNIKSDLAFSFVMERADRHYLKAENRFYGRNCGGKIMARGLLLDQALGDLEAKIYIAPEARGTDSELSEKILLLGDNAKCTAKPNLQINTDDVKANHGASISQINQEDLFYLLSRGIEKKNAIDLIKKGFLLSPFETKKNHFWRKAMSKYF